MNWEDPLQGEMATHISILAWEITGTVEPGGLQTMGWQRLGHDLVTNSSSSPLLHFQSQQGHSEFFSHLIILTYPSAFLFLIQGPLCLRWTHQDNPDHLILK